MDKKNKVAVVVFGEGPGSFIKSGDKAEGFGESNLNNDEAKSIAQQIQNDYPDVTVIFSKYDGLNSVTTHLDNANYEHLVFIGLKRGANSAIGATNTMTDHGKRVDLVVTIDLPSARDGVLSDPFIKRPGMVDLALNYMWDENGKRIEAAKNFIIIPEMRERAGTPFKRETMEDILAPTVVERVEDRLPKLLNKSYMR